MRLTYWIVTYQSQQVMTVTTDSVIFEKLLKLIPNLEQLNSALKMTAPGYMDLGVDLLEHNHQKRVIALSHYYLHPSGDMIPDPDMTIAVYFGTKTAEALSYQDCFGYRRVYTDDMAAFSPTAKKELNHFLNQWLSKLIEQGHQAN